MLKNIYYKKNPGIQKFEVINFWLTADLDFVGGWRPKISG
jgi:hypothetical protein